MEIICLKATNQKDFYVYPQDLMSYKTMKRREIKVLEFFFCI